MAIKTAEAVSPYHPDKICDQISDLLLDRLIAQDPFSRVAIETMGGHGRLVIIGEVTSRARLTRTDVINHVVGAFPFLADYAFSIALHQQSPAIAQGVDQGGAGDQGIMIGYATAENDVLIPQELYLARQIARHVFEKYPFDGKTQVTLRGNTIESIVCSFQNSRADALAEHIRERFSAENYYVNPAGDWDVGAFDADTGLTGRKLMVDNYGPNVEIGGGCFSGKDPTKVDRSGAYMARKIAVDYLTQKGAAEVTVKLAYAIGKTAPLMAVAVIDGREEHITGYDLSPAAMIAFLDLRRPIYLSTAAWGHFGNAFPWDKAR